MVFGAGLTLGGDWTSQPYEQGKKPYAPADVYVAAELTNSFAAYPIEESNRCYSAKHHDSADLCAQWRAAIAAEKAANAAVWSNRLSIIGAGLTLIATVFVWLGFRETKKTANAAIEAVAETRIANDISRDVSRRELRAYINLNRIIIEDFGADPIQIFVEALNFGNTPATNVKHWCFFHHMPSSFPGGIHAPYPMLPEAVAETPPNTAVAIIAKGNPVIAPISPGEPSIIGGSINPLSVAEGRIVFRAAFNDGSRIGHVMGRIVYDDIFGKEQITEYHFYFGADLGIKLMNHHGSEILQLYHYPFENTAT